MARAIALIIGGAVVNALAFTGSNIFFSIMANDAEIERKWHDKAIEELQAAQAAWSKKGKERLDFLKKKSRNTKGTICRKKSLMMLN